jgi:hypothetical protein
MIGDLDRATFSNIEHQGMEFLQFSLGPWLRQIEQSIHAQMMRSAERQTYFVEHVRDAILQADTATRYAAYAVGRQWGWLSTNDVRELENMNPIDNGDVYLTPLNMVEAGTQDGSPDATVQDRGAVWWGPLVEDVGRRLARRHVADWGRAGVKVQDEAWQERHYGALAVATSEMVQPLLRAADVTAELSEPVVAAMRAECVDEDALAAAIAARLADAIGGV